MVRAAPSRDRLLRCFGTLLALLAASPASAQGLTILPIAIHMAAGQMATTLTVINQDDREISFQVRPFAWSQQDGTDRLTATNDLVASPPLGTIAAGRTQVVRLVLRRSPQGREATYRILLDQISPPGSPGTVHLALRLSLPIFAEPASRVVPHLQWHIESGGGQSSLVAVNDGGQHDTIRNIALTSGGSVGLKLDVHGSPYVLAGDTHRWRILGSAPASGGPPRLTALCDSGPIDQVVPVGAVQ